LRSQKFGNDDDDDDDDDNNNNNNNNNNITIVQSFRCSNCAFISLPQFPI